MAFNLTSMLDSLKSQTASIASNIKVPTSLNLRSSTVKEKNCSTGKQYKWPSIFEQLQWPVLFGNDKLNRTNDEDDIIEKFIKVIQCEEEDENAMSTFYNHPQRRRTDREEIRRKLAMGADEDNFNDRQFKKPSLQSRLQSGKNLQICFMNETASDCESQCSDTESTQDRIDEMEGIINAKESKLAESDSQNTDFVTHQARLQAEARMALAQAKEMARMQMEIEKQNQKKSPITEIVKDSFNKIGFPFPAGKRRMSRQLLTDMNVAQLQVIVNDLHTQIENLNEDLVRFLLNRDDLHMEQDSMLVDIEDLTKHLGAKQRPNSVVTTNGVVQHKKFPDPYKSLKPASFTKTQKLKSLVKK